MSEKSEDMNTEGHFTDKFSYLLGSATFLASFYIYYRDTSLMKGSLVAALLTAGLVWMTYLMVRWLLLANKSP